MGSSAVDEHGRAVPAASPINARETLAQEEPLSLAATGALVAVPRASLLDAALSVEKVAEDDLHAAIRECADLLSAGSAEVSRAVVQHAEAVEWCAPPAAVQFDAGLFVRTLLQGAPSLDDLLVRLYAMRAERRFDVGSVGSLLPAGVLDGARFVAVVMVEPIGECPFKTAMDAVCRLVGCVANPTLGAIYAELVASVRAHDFETAHSHVEFFLLLTGQNDSPLAWLDHLFVRDGVPEGVLAHWVDDAEVQGATWSRAVQGVDDASYIASRARPLVDAAGGLVEPINWVSSLVGQGSSIRRVADFISRIAGYFCSAVDFVKEKVDELVPFVASLIPVTLAYCKRLAVTAPVLLASTAVLAKVVTRDSMPGAVIHALNDKLVWFTQVVGLDKLFVEDPSVPIMKEGKEEDYDAPLVGAQVQAGGGSSLVAIALAVAALPRGMDSRLLLGAVKALPGVVAGLEIAGSGLFAFIDAMPAAVQRFLEQAGLRFPVEGLSADERNLLVQCESCITTPSEAEANRIYVEHSERLKLCYMDMVLRLGPTKPSARYVVTVYQRMFAQLETRALSVSDKAHTTPVGVFFGGPPGVGKSEVAGALALALRPDVVLGARVANVNTNDRFLSSEHGQPVVLFDDVFQGEPSDVSAACATMIKCISSVAFIPNRAEIGQKGRPLRAEYVFATANVLVGAHARGVDQRAFWRRFLGFNVSLKEGFATAEGVVDVQAIEAAKLLPGYVPWSHLDFKPVHYQDRRPAAVYEEGDPITFQELVERVRVARAAAVLRAQGRQADADGMRRHYLDAIPAAQSDREPNPFDALDGSSEDEDGDEDAKEEMVTAPEVESPAPGPDEPRVPFDPVMLVAGEDPVYRGRRVTVGAFWLRLVDRCPRHIKAQVLRYEHMSRDERLRILLEWMIRYPPFQRTIDVRRFHAKYARWPSGVDIMPYIWASNVDFASQAVSYSLPELGHVRTWLIHGGPRVVCTVFERANGREIPLSQLPEDPTYVAGGPVTIPRVRGVCPVQTHLRGRAAFARTVARGVRNMGRDPVQLRHLVERVEKMEEAIGAHAPEASQLLRSGRTASADLALGDLALPDALTQTEVDLSRYDPPVAGVIDDGFGLDEPESRALEWPEESWRAIVALAEMANANQPLREVPVASDAQPFYAAYLRAAYGYKESLPWKWIFGFCGAVTAGVAMFRFFAQEGAEDSDSDDDWDEDGSVQSDQRKKGGRKRRRVRAAGKSKKMPESHRSQHRPVVFRRGRGARVQAGVFDSKSDAFMLSVQRRVMKIGRAQVFVSRVDASGARNKLNGLLVGARLLLLPAHFFDTTVGCSIKEGDVIKLDGFAVSFSFEFSRRNLLLGATLTELLESQPEQLEELRGRIADHSSVREDFALYQLPKAFQQQPSLFDCFCTSGDFDSGAYEDTDYACITTPVRHGSVHTHEAAGIGVPELQSRFMFYATPGVERSQYYIPQFLAYKELQRGGDCGALVLLVGRDGVPKIAGMHVAQRALGGVEHGIASVLMHESVSLYRDELGDKLGVTVQAGVEGLSVPELVQQALARPLDTLDAGGRIGNGYVVLGKVKDELYGSCERTTTLIPSAIADADFLAGVTKGPAHLSRTDACPYTGYELLLRQLGQEPTPVEREFDPHILREVIEDMVAEDELRCPMGGVVSRVLTTDEAINGVREFGSFRGLPVTTSAGWPHMYEDFHKGRGKKGLLLGESGSYVPTPEFAKEIDEMEELVRGAIVPCVSFVAVLMDELRSAKKLGAFLSRAITVGPAALVVMFRKYFGARLAYIRNNHSRSPSAVGINPYSSQWDELVRYMSEGGPLGWDGDIEKFEGVLRKLMNDELFMYHEAWYKKHDVNWCQEDCNARAALFSLSITNYMQVGRTLMKKEGALLNSGVAGTTELFNTPQTRALGRYAYKCLAAVHAPELSSGEHFDRLVRGVAYGDDNWYATRLPWFNAITMAAVLLPFGVVYTPASKGAVPVEKKAVTDCEFIGNYTFSGNHVPGITYYAAPSWERTLPGLKYTRRTLPFVGSTVEKCNDALRRAWGWSRDDWHRLRDLCVGALRESGGFPDLITWVECKSLFLRGELTPDDFEEEEDEYNARRPPPVSRQRLFVNSARMEDAVMGAFVQMEVAPGNVEAPQQVTELAPDSGTLVVEKDLTLMDRSVSAFCKRGGLWFDGRAGEVVYVSSLFVGDPFQGIYPAGQASWWGSIYRHWYGGVQVKVRNFFGGEVVHSPEFFTEPEFVQALNVLPVIGVPMFTGPVAVGSVDSSISQMEIPCRSRYGLFRVPRTAGDARFPQYGPGTVYFNVRGPDLLRVFASFADETRLANPYRMPVIRFGTVSSEEAKEALFGAQVQMMKMKGQTVGVDFADSNSAESGGRAAQLPGQEAASERGIDMIDLARRPQLVATFVWPPAAAPGTLLYRALLPSDVLVGLNSIPFNTFVYFRATLRMRITVNSGPFQQGQLIAWAMPDTPVSELLSESNNRVTQTMGMHVTMMAGRPTDVTLEIPFMVTQDLLRSSDSLAGIASFGIAVFNPLLSGAGLLPPVTVSVFASMDADFQVLDPSVVPRLRLPRSIGNGRARAAPLVGAAVQGAVQSGLGVASNVLKSASAGVDFVKKATAGLDAKETDRPNVGSQIMPVVKRPFFEVSNIDGVDFGTVLAEDGKARVVSEDRVAGGGGTTLRELVSRYTFMDTFRWETQVSGSVLYELPMTCAPRTFLSSPGQVTVPTLLEFATLPFAFWRGSLRVRLVMVTAGLQTGRLGIVSRYGQPAGAVGLDESFSQYLMVVDLTAEQTVFEFDLPYRSETQMLSVPRRGVAPADVFNYAMGFWQVVVLNELQTNESVASAVEINVYLAAGPDFEVDYLREISNNVVVVR